jgi:hypothetical protein
MASSVGELGVAPHGELGAVDLQEEARLDDGLVLLSHHVRHGLEVCLVVRVVLVREHVRDDAR